MKLFDVVVCCLVILHGSSSLPIPESPPGGILSGPNLKNTENGQIPRRDEQITRVKENNIILKADQNDIFGNPVKAEMPHSRRKRESIATTKASITSYKYESQPRRSRFRYIKKIQKLPESEHKLQTNSQFKQEAIYEENSSIQNETHFEKFEKEHIHTTIDSKKKVNKYSSKTESNKSINKEESRVVKNSEQKIRKKEGSKSEGNIVMSQRKLELPIGLQQIEKSQKTKNQKTLKTTTVKGIEASEVVNNDEQKMKEMSIHEINHTTTSVTSQFSEKKQSENNNTHTYKKDETEEDQKQSKKKGSKSEGNIVSRHSSDLGNEQEQFQNSHESENQNTSNTTAVEGIEASKVVNSDEQKIEETSVHETNHTATSSKSVKSKKNSDKKQSENNNTHTYKKDEMEEDQKQSKKKGSKSEGKIVRSQRKLELPIGLQQIEKSHESKNQNISNTTAVEGIEASKVVNSDEQKIEETSVHETNHTATSSKSVKSKKNSDKKQSENNNTHTYKKDETYEDQEQTKKKRSKSEGNIVSRHSSDLGNEQEQFQNSHESENQNTSNTTAVEGIEASKLVTNDEQNIEETSVHETNDTATSSISVKSKKITDKKQSENNNTHTYNKDEMEEDKKQSKKKGSKSEGNIVSRHSSDLGNEQEQFQNSHESENQNTSNTAAVEGIEASKVVNSDEQKIEETSVHETNHTATSSKSVKSKKNSDKKQSENNNTHTYKKDETNEDQEQTKKKGSKSEGKIVRSQRKLELPIGLQQIEKSHESKNQNTSNTTAVEGIEASKVVNSDEQKIEETSVHETNHTATSSKSVKSKKNSDKKQSENNNTHTYKKDETNEDQEQTKKKGSKSEGKIVRSQRKLELPIGLQQIEKSHESKNQNTSNTTAVEGIEASKVVNSDEQKIEETSVHETNHTATSSKSVKSKKNSDKKQSENNNTHTYKKDETNEDQEQTKKKGSKSEGKIVRSQRKLELPIGLQQIEKSHESKNQNTSNTTAVEGIEASKVVNSDEQKIEETSVHETNHTATSSKSVKSKKNSDKKQSENNNTHTYKKDETNEDQEQTKKKGSKSEGKIVRSQRKLELPIGLQQIEKSHESKNQNTSNTTAVEGIEASKVVNSDEQKIEETSVHETNHTATSSKSVKSEKNSDKKQSENNNTHTYKKDETKEDQQSKKKTSKPEGKIVRSQRKLELPIGLQQIEKSHESKNQNTSNTTAVEGIEASKVVNSDEQKIEETSVHETNHTATSSKSVKSKKNSDKKQSENNNTHTYKKDETKEDQQSKKKTSKPEGKIVRSQRKLELPIGLQQIEKSHESKNQNTSNTTAVEGIEASKVVNSDEQKIEETSVHETNHTATSSKSVKSKKNSDKKQSENNNTHTYKKDETKEDQQSKKKTSKPEGKIVRSQRKLELPLGLQQIEKSHESKNQNTSNMTAVEGIEASKVVNSDEQKIEETSVHETNHTATSSKSVKSKKISDKNQSENNNTHTYKKDETNEEQTKKKGSKSEGKIVRSQRKLELPIGLQQIEKTHESKNQNTSNMTAVEGIEASKVVNSDEQKIEETSVHETNHTATSSKSVKSEKNSDKNQSENNNTHTYKKDETNEDQEQTKKKGSKSEGKIVRSQRKLELPIGLQQIEKTHESKNQNTSNMTAVEGIEASKVVNSDEQKIEETSIHETNHTATSSKSVKSKKNSDKKQSGNNNTHTYNKDETKEDQQSKKKTSKPEGKIASSKILNLDSQMKQSRKQSEDSLKKKENKQTPLVVLVSKPKKSQVEVDNTLWRIPVVTADGKVEYLSMSSAEGEAHLIHSVDSNGKPEYLYSIVDKSGHTHNLHLTTSEGQLLLMETVNQIGQHVTGFIGYDETGEYIIPLHFEHGHHLVAENLASSLQSTVDVHPAYELVSPQMFLTPVQNQNILTLENNIKNKNRKPSEGSLKMNENKKMPLVKKVLKPKESQVEVDKTQSHFASEVFNRGTNYLTKSSHDNLNIVQLNEKTGKAAWEVPVITTDGKVEYLSMSSAEREAHLIHSVDSNGKPEYLYSIVDKSGHTHNLHLTTSEGQLSLMETVNQIGQHVTGFIGYDETGEYIIPLHFEHGHHLVAENLASSLQSTVDVHPAYELVSPQMFLTPVQNQNILTLENNKKNKNRKPSEGSLKMNENKKMPLVKKVLKPKGSQVEVDKTQSHFASEVFNRGTNYLTKSSHDNLNIVRLNEKTGKATREVPVITADGKVEYLSMGSTEREAHLKHSVDSNGKPEYLYSIVDKSGHTHNLHLTTSEGQLSLMETGNQKGQHVTGFIGYDETGKYIIPLHFEQGHYEVDENLVFSIQ